MASNRNIQQSLWVNYTDQMPLVVESERERLWRFSSEIELALPGQGWKLGRIDLQNQKRNLGSGVSRECLFEFKFAKKIESHWWMKTNHHSWWSSIVGFFFAAIFHFVLLFSRESGNLEQRERRRCSWRKEGPIFI